jgi:hypothetical protein
MPRARRFGHCTIAFPVCPLSATSEIEYVPDVKDVDRSWSHSNADLSPWISRRLARSLRRPTMSDEVRVSERG